MSQQIITPIQEINEDSSEYETDSSSDENENNEFVLSNNRGVIQNQFSTERETFIDRNDQTEYVKLRDNLFTKSITKFPLLVDSKNTRPSKTSGSFEPFSLSDNLVKQNIITNSSNYIVSFHGSESKNNTAGFGEIKNVIGFRLLKAIIPNSGYQVTENNKFVTMISDGSQIDFTLELTPGKYSVHELGDHLKSTINAYGTVIGGGTVRSDYNVIYNSTTLKYDIEGAENFMFKWYTNFIKYKSSAYRLFGFYNINDDTKSGNKISDRAVDLSTHFVDLVIPEIPKIGCKKNYLGKSIIDRIPLSETSGGLVHYNNDDNDDHQNFFYPINLNQITIQLYDDTSTFFYDSQNADNSFEFEITTFNMKQKGLTKV